MHKKKGHIKIEAKLPFREIPFDDIDDATKEQFFHMACYSLPCKDFFYEAYQQGGPQHTPISPLISKHGNQENKTVANRVLHPLQLAGEGKRGRRAASMTPQQLEENAAKFASGGHTTTHKNSTATNKNSCPIHTDNNKTETAEFPIGNYNVYI